MGYLGYIVVAIGAYLLGSIPTGYLLGRAKGVDIRTVGSGNIGATNVFRILGKPAGVFVLLIDGVKGFVAVATLINWYPSLHAMFPGIFESYGPDQSPREALGIIAGVFAVLGHNYTCWLGFKGGKGIATSAGVLIALVPWALLVIFGLWIILFLLTRYVSIGSLGASFTLPFATWFTTHSWTLTAVTSLMAALAIYKHRGNIQRLLKGTEPRLSLKGRPSIP